MFVYDIFEMISEYFAEPKWLVLFIISIINFAYLYFRRKKFFIIVLSILAIVIFNNLSILIVEKFSSATFYRNLWLIPVPHIIAASVMLILGIIRSDKVRYRIIGILLMLLISNSSFEKVFPDGLPRNKYLISDDVPILYDAIKKDLKFPHSRPKVLMSTYLWWMFNEYDAEIRNIDVSDELINSIYNGEEELIDLKRAISIHDPQYIIASVTYTGNSYSDSIDFKEITRTNSFVLYKIYVNGINKEIVFDDNINETREYCYDINDDLVMSDQGYAVSFSEYNKKNQLIKKMFYGTDLKPVMMDHGCAEFRRYYNSKDQLILEEYYDIDGNRCLNMFGISAVEFVRDDKGDVIDEKYFGVDGKKILNNYNVSETKYERNELGRVISLEYYGLEGERVLNSSGISKYEYGYDDYGNLNMECYYGIDDERIIIGGHWKVKRTFDEKGNKIHEEYLGIDGEPVMILGNCAMVDYIYDENGNMSRAIIRDITGSVVEEKMVG